MNRLVAHALSVVVVGVLLIIGHYSHPKAAPAPTHAIRRGKAAAAFVIECDRLGGEIGTEGGDVVCYR